MGASARRTVLAPFHPDIDPARYERLRGLTIRNHDKRYAPAAVESGKRLVCRLSEYTPKNDRDRAGDIARYLATEAARVDGFNYKAALRRANVDRYFDLKAMRVKPSSLKDIRTALYDAGRLTHPREFPAKKVVGAGPRRSPTTAASMDRVDALYAVAPVLPRIHSRRLLVMLDLCFGAGARPRDLKTIRGVDVDHTQWGGQPVALVRRDNLTGGTRIVPVVDPTISQRLIDVAAERGARYLITTGNREMTRNSVNEISEYLLRRGHEPIKAQALRHRWILNLAATVPAALMLQLADVKDAKVVSWHREQLPTFGLQHALAYLKEANQ
ncbi:hypothetical protein [Mycobacterium marinum]|uniref:hypothetical protein n=1 Tax=Mycobacterium marinum TaxID=1781 RepID=UPI00114053AD|nr:hypothetical protein [Mycobacterium marinum]